jgi:Outer membrane protein beta-barrel domain
MQKYPNSETMKVLIQPLLLLFVFCFAPAFLLGQQRFRAGIILGVNASQIDGDRSAGYNKLGLQTGLRAISRLKGRTEASIEFLFSQRGCQSELVKDEFSNFFSLTTNYLEVPVQWHYKDWLIEGEGDEPDYYKVSFNGGFSYARLLGTKVNDDLSAIRVIAPDYLKKNDISFLLGANFFANRHLCFTFRYVRSIGFMYDPRDWNPAPAQSGWNSHSLYFQSAWMF